MRYGLCVYNMRVHRTRVSQRAGCYIMVITCRTSVRRTYERGSFHPRAAEWLLINVRRSNRIAIKLTIAM